MLIDIIYILLIDILFLLFIEKIVFEFFFRGFILIEELKKEEIFEGKFFVKEFVFGVGVVGVLGVVIVVVVYIVLDKEFSDVVKCLEVYVVIFDDEFKDKVFSCFFF